MIFHFISHYILIKFSAHERFWNNLHQVAQNHKIGKPNNLIVVGAQDLWALMLSRSFFSRRRSTWIRYQKNYILVKIVSNMRWKKLLHIKSLGTDKTGVTPMRSEVAFFNYKTLQNKHNIRTLSGNIKTVRNSFSEWLSDCLAPTQQFYSYISWSKS
jgi:hypothetical protein